MTTALVLAVFLNLTAAPPGSAPVETVAVNGPDEGVDGQGGDGDDLPLLAAPVEIVRVLVAAPVQIVRVPTDVRPAVLVAAPVEILRVAAGTTTALARQDR
jgi:hypothetical protein